ncbi:L-aspartate decarboxylase dtxS4 [Exophiala dermatitidis]
MVQNGNSRNLAANGHTDTNRVVNNGEENHMHVHGNKAVHANGSAVDNTPSTTAPSRAQELQSLLSAVIEQLIPFIEAADSETRAHKNHEAITKSALVDLHPASELRTILTDTKTLSLPEQGVGQSGLISTLNSILQYSVNTSGPGFLDKLYSAPVPPGIAADLVLSILNTNLHVYQVSPALSLIETHVTRALANLFGFTGPRAGGINVQGGSASNMTSIVIARNTLFPETKTFGNSANGRSLVIFTSEHGHYSIEKAAQQCGFGSASVISVPVDAVTGEMDPVALEDLIVKAQRDGKTPFYVNATAGTTVLGSFDPFPAIAAVARKYGLWMHVDGAWGGSFVFGGDGLRSRALRGVELADSIAVNPHKMLGVPVTCSFLLLRDLRHAHRANTLRAGYLFHDKDDDDDDDDEEEEGVGDQKVDGQNRTVQDGHDPQSESNGVHHLDRDEDSDNDDNWTPPEDLADLTLQCGRRGDSLKFFFAWQYYGTSGYRAKIEHAYSVACHFANLIEHDPDLVLVSTNPPPCLQVCFYFAPGGKMVYEYDDDSNGHEQTSDANAKQVKKLKAKVKAGKRNSTLTSKISRLLISRGFLLDFAPALSHEVDKGSFFRAVINISTTKATLERLVEEIKVAGRAIVQNLNK